MTSIINIFEHPEQRKSTNLSIGDIPRTYRDVCGAGANPEFGITGQASCYSVLRFLILII